MEKEESGHEDEETQRGNDGDMGKRKLTRILRNISVSLLAFIVKNIIYFYNNIIFTVPFYDFKLSIVCYL